MTPEELMRAVLTKAGTMSRPAYRGQADASWQPLSGAVRRLRKAYGDAVLKDENDLRTLVARYHAEQLIMPMAVIDGTDMSDMQRLSTLQHQGAATGLLDFTENALVALWFACAEWPDKDGKVFILDLGDPQAAVNGRALPDPFDSPQPLVYYEPDRSLGARIIAQQSLFVICNPQIPNQYLSSVVVPQEAKAPLREYLTRLGFSEAGLFRDVPGLAASNAARMPLQHAVSLTPRQHRDRGNRAYLAGRYDDALSAYEAYATARPDVAQPHCLRGDALAALGRFDEAVTAYTKAIDNINRPIDTDGSVAVSWEPVGNRMLHALYFNRGNAHAATGNHLSAVRDFDSALIHGEERNTNVLFNRGNSKFAMEMFMEAHEDFEAVWSKNERSDAALAMGNCKVKIGDFEEAMHRYLNGSASEPTDSAAHCQTNAEQVRRLLEALQGCDFQERRDRSLVVVKSECGRGTFPIAGNRGNAGNVPSGMTTAPGGKGYEGTMGFAVTIESPAP